MSRAGTADRPFVVKLMMLGDSEVGKTALTTQFVDNKFQETYITSIGLDFKTKKVERSGRKLAIEVWDTAGHEKFNTIARAYYRRAMGMVITYSVANRGSFDHVVRWLSELEMHGDTAVQRILVGNKSDLEDERRVSTEEGEQLASSKNMQFFETSALTGHMVEEAFFYLADLVAEQRYSGKMQKTEGHQLKSGSERKKKGCDC